MSQPAGFQALPPPAGWETESRSRLPRRWPWIVGGCCGVPCLLIVILGVVATVVALMSGSPGAPTGFPRYPGSLQAVHINTGGRLDSGVTTTVLVYFSRDSVDRVEDFYAIRLDRAPWHITSQDDGCRCIQFTEDGTSLVGRIKFISSDPGTRYTVTFLR